jgi:glycosyltransferase involved in cell wall biosynthesis
VKKKNALVLAPSWIPNATCTNITLICDTLRCMGYSLCLVVYSLSDIAPSGSPWDHVYTLRPTIPSFGLTHPFGRDRSTYDANLIDDWVGDDLLAFIKFLDRNCHFELCLCNYVYLSKIFSCFDSGTKKILATHDIFSGRNERLYNNGTASFTFGTVLSEEKKGLERADYIIAVQEKEKLFFEDIIDKPVITLPYVPTKKYRNHTSTSLPLKVGYIASANAPNITAIEKYIKLVQTEKNIAIYIIGSISFAIKHNFPNVYLLGIIDDLDEFYSRYDLYINPDTFESGLKVKTVEAFSYGRPVICTKEAAVGIEVTEIYHQAESIEALAEITKKCIKNPVFLTEIAEESKIVYDKFYDKYPTYEILDRIVKAA